MPTFPSTIREAVGPYAIFPLEYTFESTFAANTAGVRGADEAGVIVNKLTMPWPGWVAAMSVNSASALGAGTDFKILVNGTEVAASETTPGAVTDYYTTFANTVAQLAAGDEVGVEVDTETGLTDTVVTLWVVANVGD